MNRGGSENIGSDDGREKDSIWSLLFDTSSKSGGDHTINFACGRGSGGSGRTMAIKKVVVGGGEESNDNVDWARDLKTNKCPNKLGCRLALRTPLLWKIRR